MIKEFGLDRSETETCKTISYIEYTKQIDKKLFDSKDQIAVITAEGVIRGDISQGVAGAKGIVKQIRSAHESEKTKAIVFRINILVD